jgi:hypothetical protein
MTRSLELGLLLSHADDGLPFAGETLAPENAGGMPDPGDERRSAPMLDHGADPNDLPRQRWGVVAPEGARGDRLLALIDPLVKARAADQAGRPVVIERVPANHDTTAARTFRASLATKRPISDQPRYWLVLGDLDEVSLETGQTLATNHYVGRLGFRRDDAYEAYVAKVLGWEKNPSAAPAGRALFHTAPDHHPATLLGRRVLVEPVRESCETQQRLGELRVGAVESVEAATAKELSAALGAPDPSVLLSVSHGASAPKRGWSSREEEKRLSGAMILGGGERVTAEDVARGPFLPGGIWFFFACFGAGMPSRSAYEPWLRDLSKKAELAVWAKKALLGLPQGSPPFLAALPQAALANADGPLVVIGHVDLAWSYAFTDPDMLGNQHAERFYGVIRALVEGRRAGIGHGEVMRFFQETCVDLSSMYDEEAQADLPIESFERDILKAHLWMRRHDLGHYVLLGDPAVRLPIAGNRIVRAGIEGGAEPSIEVMEAAALAILGNGERAEDVAARMGLGVDAATAWARAYREAGRERLFRIRSGSGS